MSEIAEGNDLAWLVAAAKALKATLPQAEKKAFIALMFEAGFWDSEKLTWDAAVSRLNECLRNDGASRQFLKVSELWAWMRSSGHHALFRAMADDLGYRVERLPTEQRIADLLERIDRKLTKAADAQVDAAALRDAVERLLHPAQPPREGAPTRFSVKPEAF
ncbi:hypothetical protein [Dokdonella soli]|uniref:DUF3486 family protein n=1 Tax=Dokdonella soli TaxID=529810 RepID=A0ABN1IUX9_9GAMM